MRPTADGWELGLRAVARFDDPSVSEQRTCEAEACGETTRGGKPFCTQHVERSDYVQRLMRTLARAEREVERVRASGARAVDPEGLTCSEILRELRVHGPRSAQRLARTLALEPHVLRVYLRVLALAGRVRLRLAQRGRLMVYPVTPRVRSVA